MPWKYKNEFNEQIQKNDMRTKFSIGFKTEKISLLSLM